MTTARTQGTPQGGPLSPLLSNILLDELDRELEARGHAFCRYADDVQIYVHTDSHRNHVTESRRVLGNEHRLSGLCSSLWLQFWLQTLSDTPGFLRTCADTRININRDL